LPSAQVTEALEELLELPPLALPPLELPPLEFPPLLLESLLELPPLEFPPLLLGSLLEPPLEFPPLFLDPPLELPPLDELAPLELLAPPPLCPPPDEPPPADCEQPLKTKTKTNPAIFNELRTGDRMRHLRMARTMTWPLCLLKPVNRPVRQVRFEAFGLSWTYGLEHADERRARGHA
jgi:hypothetical protein